MFHNKVVNTRLGAISDNTCPLFPQAADVNVRLSDRYTKSKYSGTPTFEFNLWNAITSYWGCRRLNFSTLLIFIVLYRKIIDIAICNRHQRFVNIVDYGYLVWLVVRHGFTRRHFFIYLKYIYLPSVIKAAASW